MKELQDRYRGEIEELVEATRRLGDLGYVTSHGGNLSYRVNQEHILITPTKVVKRHVTFEDIVVISADGEIRYKPEHRKPTGETPMHVRLYKRRPDLRGIVHAHPPYLTGFALAGSDILSRPLLPEPIIEVGPVVTVPYAEPVSEELAQRFDDVVPRSNAWLMRSHGMTIGSTEGVGRALELLEMTEALAASVATAMQVGEVREIPRGEVERLERTLASRNMILPGDPRVIERLSDLYY
jgi:L-fuculose-phosphate aldolase